MNTYLSELQEKDVISINTGYNLGHIVDALISSDGKIIEFVVQNKKIFKKSSYNENIFTINDIEKIGEDVILVRI